MAVSSRFYTPLVDAFVTTDAVLDGGTTHHIRWVRTPGPVVDQVMAWWAATAG